MLQISRSRRALLLTTGIVAFAVGLGTAYAISNSQSATDALGQTNGDLASPQPIFTKGATNDVANKLGISAPVTGLAIDTTGHRFFLSDTVNNRILEYNLDSSNNLVDRIPDNVIGQTNFYFNTAANTQSGLNAPNGLAYDTTNKHLFVAEATGNRVKMFDVATITNGMNATNVLGQATFTTLAAATTQDGLNVPVGLAYDGSNNRLYVAQTTGNRVSVFSTAAISDGEPATYVLGQANFTATAAAVTQSGLNAPTDVAYDSAKNRILVCDGTNNRIMVFSGSVLATGMNANYVLGQTNYTNTTAGTTQAGLNSPTGVAVDTTNARVYVIQSGASRVSIFNAPLSVGMNAADLLGQYDGNLSAPGPVYTKGTANNAPNPIGLNAPQGIALDTTNHRLFVSDMTNNRVLVYGLDSSNKLVDRIPDNVIGQTNFVSNGAATTQNGLSAPTGVDFDTGNNRLFVADNTNNRVLVYKTASLSNGMNAANVLGQVNFTIATAGTTQLNFSNPRQVAFDALANQLYVADTTNNRIEIFDTSTIVDGEPATYNLGQDDGLVSTPSPVYTKGTANNAPEKLGLNAPSSGIALDGTNHRLFLTDTTNNRVLVYGLDSSNNLSDRIPDYVLGQANFWSNAAATTQAGLNVPYGLAYDSGKNRLFVAQGTGNRVTVYDVSSITNGQNAIYVLGEANYTTNTAALTQAGLNLPVDLAYDSANSRLFVAEQSNNRVKVYSLAAGTVDGMNADNAIGQIDDSLSAPGPIYTKGSANTGPSKLGLNAPIIGVAMDTTGHELFVTDTSNNRVLVYDLDSSNNLLDRLPDHVLGQVNFYSNAAATTQIGLNVPNGLACDVTGRRLFVAQTTGNRVSVFDISSISDGMNAVHVLGQVNFTTATAATTQIGLNVPTGVAYDSANKRVFVAQNTGNRVSVFSGATLTDGQYANFVLGQANFTATAAATTQAGMNVPYDVAYDASRNRLFVSEGTSNRVLIFSGAVLQTGMNANYVLGQANYTTATAASSQVGMNAPRGIAYDSARNFLFVSQTTGNRVTVYSGAVLQTGMNANYVIGQANFTTATANTTQSGLNAPTGCLVDTTNNRVYVPQSGASRVSIFNTLANGMNAADLLGQYDDNTSTPGPIYTKGTANNGPNMFGLSAPLYGLALDTVNHRLFVSDTSNNRVLVYNLDSNNLLLDRIPDYVLGQANFYGNAAATTQTGLNVPNGIAYDSAKNRIFVAQGSGNRVSVFSGSVLATGMNANFVLGQTNYTNTTAALTQTGLNVPVDVAYDSSKNRIFVSDGTNNRVMVFSGSVLQTGMNANYVIGQANYITATANTTQTGLNAPRGVVFDTTNNRLYVSQATANRVTIYSGAVLQTGMNANYVIGQANYTTATAGSTQTGLNDPRGIDFAYDGVKSWLYVAQSTGNRVMSFNVTPGTIATNENATNVFGQQLFTVVTAGTTRDGLSAPSAVRADLAHNRLYVLDTTNNRIVTYNLTDGIGSNMNALYVLGQANFTTATATVTQTGMNAPNGLAYDSAHAKLYVTELSNNRTLVFTGSSIATNMNANYVIGQANYITATANTTQNGLNAPRGVAIDATNNKLYISQTTGNRVTVYNAAALATGMNATNVLGQPTFTTATANTRQAGLNNPIGVLVDPPNNRLYVLQSAANRVSIFNVASITDGMNASDLLGQTDDSLSVPAPIYTKGTINNAPYILGLSGPQGIAIDSVNHRLFIADSANNRILVYALTGGDALIDRIPDYVLGQPNFYTNATNSTQNGLSSPLGLTFDATDNVLFAADFTNNRVLGFDTTAITNGENAVLVLGQPSFTAVTAATTQVGLSGPRMVEYDAQNGQLYVADTTNNRIAIYGAITYYNSSSSSSAAAGSNTNNTFYFYGF